MMIAINVLIDLWEAHGKKWADQNPQVQTFFSNVVFFSYVLCSQKAMVAILILITVLLWWFF